MVVDRKHDTIMIASNDIEPKVDKKNMTCIYYIDYRHGVTIYTRSCL